MLVRLKISIFVSELDNALSLEKNMKFIGSMWVKDLQNKYLAEIKFILPKKGSMLGSFWGKKKETTIGPADLNKIEIEVRKDKEVLCKGGYDYLANYLL